MSKKKKAPGVEEEELKYSTAIDTHTEQGGLNKMTGLQDSKEATSTSVRKESTEKMLQARQMKMKPEFGVADKDIEPKKTLKSKAQARPNLEPNKPQVRPLPTIKAPNLAKSEAENLQRKRDLDAKKITVTNQNTMQGELTRSSHARHNVGVNRPHMSRHLDTRTLNPSVQRQNAVQAQTTITNITPSNARVGSSTAKTADKLKALKRQQDAKKKAVAKKTAEMSVTPLTPMPDNNEDSNLRLKK